MPLKNTENSRCFEPPWTKVLATLLFIFFKHPGIRYFAWLTNPVTFRNDVKMWPFPCETQLDFPKCKDHPYLVIFIIKTLIIYRRNLHRRLLYYLWMAFWIWFSNQELEMNLKNFGWQCNVQYRRCPWGNAYSWSRNDWYWRSKHIVTKSR